MRSYILATLTGLAGLFAGYWLGYRAAPEVQINRSSMTWTPSIPFSLRTYEVINTELDARLKKELGDRALEDNAAYLLPMTGEDTFILVQGARSRRLTGKVAKDIDDWLSARMLELEAENMEREPAHPLEPSQSSGR
jgi:hypothetical protein